MAWTGSHPPTVQAKMLRLELLNVKADLERELGQLLGHWAHREPALHGDPAV